MKRFTVEKSLRLRLIYLDNHNHILDPRVFQLKFNLITEVDQDHELLDAQLGQNVSLAKITLFVESFLNNSLAVDVDDKDRMYGHFAEFQNNYITLPDFTESTLLETLHAKFNTVCKKNTRVEFLQLLDLESEINFTLFNNAAQDHQLPTQDEWMGPLSYWADPWWYRSDASTYDNAAVSESELSEWRLNESLSDSTYRTVFDDIENSITQSFQEAMQDAGVIPRTERGQLIEVDFVNSQSQSTAKKERWKPTLI